jgi:hypothetical protein
LGLAANIRAGGGPEDLKAMLLEQKSMGLDACAISAKWSDLEPEPGKIDVEKMGKDVAGAAAFGWKVALTIQTIDTNQRTVPPDLKAEPWDSETMRDRFSKLLAAIAGKLGDSVVAVSLGNEVDGYLVAHPAEAGPFKRFLSAGRQALRTLKPGMPVGVTCMFEGRRSNPKLIDGLFEGLDAVFFTYYPTGDAMAVRDPSTVDPDLDAMISSAAGRPLYLQEVGYPAAPLLGSSDEKQAQFVRAFYKALAKRKSKVALACYVLQTDFSPELVDRLTAYYGIDQPRFRAFLSTLGLRRSDGSPRPALQAFEEAVKAVQTAP